MPGLPRQHHHRAGECAAHASARLQRAEPELFVALRHGGQSARRHLLERRRPGVQHMIDGKPFAEDPADTKTVTLNTVEEWQIENARRDARPRRPIRSTSTSIRSRSSEIFDPNQQVLTTNQTRNRLVTKYVTTTPTNSSVQCQIDPAATGSHGSTATNPLADETAPRVWWDVFSIPVAQHQHPGDRPRIHDVCPVTSACAAASSTSRASM